MAKRDRAKYMSEYRKARYVRVRAEVEQRLGGKCAVCGSRDRMQVDHIDRTTKQYNVMMLLYTSRGALFEEEIKKCQLLCHTCHARKSAEELGHTYGKGRHGTEASHRYCGPPKCEPCRAAKRSARERRGEPERRKLAGRGR